jgi:4-hydroxymandelate oxidase
MPAARDHASNAVPPNDPPVSPPNLAAWEALAAERLNRMVYDYYAGGADDEVTLNAAHAAWREYRVRYRVLRDVRARDWRTSVLGHPLQWPMLVAPMAFQRMATPDGEIAMARAAEAAGVGMILSTLSNTPIEAVRAATSGPLWFQLYIYRDRGVTQTLLERAERAGCTAIVLTVDTPILGRRERDVANGFRLPPALEIPNTGVSLGATLSADQQERSGLAEFVREYWDAGISWKDLSWLQGLTHLPILVKGVVRADDAQQAVAHGAAGVIVSNHGGRQLDTAVTTARALPAIADALQGSAALLVDGGIRRGTDVLKALALGADAVLLGRPLLWGLAVDGQRGAERVMQQLLDEFDLAMALAGCRNRSEATTDLIDR